MEAGRVAMQIADTEAVLSTLHTQLDMMVGKEQATHLIDTTMIDPPPCPWCGRCLWIGGPCCVGMEAQMRLYTQSPEYQELVRQQRQDGLARKRATKQAKHARRMERLAIKLASWDAYDQLLIDQASWEGMGIID
jgi:hypothetical protein